MYKILIIEDDLVMAGAIKKEMEAWGNEARYVEDFAKEVCARITSQHKHRYFIKYPVNVRY